MSGDDITVTGRFTDKNAGSGKTVNLAFGGADAGNYSIRGQSTTTADITPRPITVVADAKRKTQGLADPVFTYTVGGMGLVAGERLNGTLTRDPGEAVGMYAIRQGTLTNANNPNYAISYTGADLTIAAAIGYEAPLASVQSGAADAADTMTQPVLLQGEARTLSGPASAMLLLRVEGTGIRLPNGILTEEAEERRR